MNWTGFDGFVALIELGILFLSGYIIVRFHQSFQASMASAPQLEPLPKMPNQLPTISVIIPAYNEAINIRDCVEAVLHSNLPDPHQLQIWIADDESTDRTSAIAKELLAQDARVHFLAVGPRPTQETWMGKNWACTQAAAQAQGEYLLFIDADVRLERGAIAAALTEAQTQQTDLLSCMPQVVCGCLAEWLAQPIIFRMLIAGFNIGGVNDPAQPHVAFAAGPFMLFRREAYEKIGGHRAVADDLVEDVALARQIKAAGLKMHLMVGLDLVKVRMYQNLAGLWEGWTKNLHMGANRHVSGTLMIALISFFTLTIPWIGLVVGSIELFQWGWPGGIILGASVVLLILESVLWRQQSALLKQPVRYWGLSWLGGLLAAAIAIASIIKTETGWGWTWRGRSLAMPNHAKTKGITSGG
jgi:cellulose synthase/poly-beta-1,6-N-acetylglucosamine synthase-like glycosyltransferase